MTTRGRANNLKLPPGGLADVTKSIHSFQPLSSEKVEITIPGLKVVFVFALFCFCWVNWNCLDSLSRQSFPTIPPAEGQAQRDKGWGWGNGRHLHSGLHSAPPPHQPLAGVLHPPLPTLDASHERATQCTPTYVSGRSGRTEVSELSVPCRSGYICKS